MFLRYSPIRIRTLMSTLLPLIALMTAMGIFILPLNGNTLVRRPICVGCGYNRSPCAQVSPTGCKMLKLPVRFPNHTTKPSWFICMSSAAMPTKRSGGREALAGITLSLFPCVYCEVSTISTVPLGSSMPSPFTIGSLYSDWPISIGTFLSIPNWSVPLVLLYSSLPSSLRVSIVRSYHVEFTLKSIE